MNTETVIVTRQNKLVTWQLSVTIESEPVALEDLSGRWIDSVGRDQVVSARRIKVTTNDAKYPNPHPGSTPGYEIEFKCGARGFVLDRGPKNGGQELDALVVGTKGYLHGLAVWKKCNQTRGHCVGWFSAQRSARGRQNPNTAPRCCAAELYARAAGKPEGDGVKTLPRLPVPFAPSAVRDRNARREAPDDHTERCLFCDRPMNPARVAYFVEMTTSNEVVPVGVTVEDSQGCFPVGTSCKNLVPAGYRMTKKTNPELFELMLKGPS